MRAHGQEAVLVTGAGELSPAPETAGVGTDASEGAVARSTPGESASLARGGRPRP